MNVTALYTVRDNYTIFRMAIESFLEYIPPEQCNKIIVVNDGSNERNLLAFLDYLNGNTIEGKHIRVINTGPSTKYSYYTKYGRGAKKIEENTGEKNVKTSAGHGGSINLGLKSVDTDYVLILDSDTVMLPKSTNLISSMLECFKLDEKIVSVGQVTGKIDGVKVLDSKGRLLGNGTYYEHFPNACLMMSDMRCWKEFGLKNMSNGGWAHSPYIYDLYKKGYKICNFNTFKDGYSIHLGHATIRKVRESEDVSTFGFVKDCKGYGRVRKGDVLYEWYAGYYSVTLTTEELIKYLDEEYNDLDYSVRKSVIHKIIPKELII